MWLLLALALGQTSGAPRAAETAKLYFLAGDVAKAVEWATRGLQSDAKRCKPMLKALAEYGLLANHTDEFTLEQARDFLKWDAAISPGAPGKLTQPIIDRFVTRPLAQARLLASSDATGAKAVVSQVLAVDPKNVDAAALLKTLMKSTGK